MKFWPIFISLFINIPVFSQQTSSVDFKTAQVNISIQPNQKVVSGQVNYLFDILKPTDSIFVDAQNMAFKKVRFNNDFVHWSNDGKKLWIINKFKPSKNNQLAFEYEAHPKKALYFIDWEDPSASSGQVWTQGQGKYTSNWLPSFDDMNEKVEFDLNITFDKSYEVIANGKLINKQINDSTTIWHYDMKEPMASYLVALAIGKYSVKTEFSKSGVPIELYYYPKDSNKVEPTYRYTKQIFDFFEDEIGVPYPWQNYKEVPVKNFLYAGMENTSTTIFSDAFVVDSVAFNDKNFVNVNAHELAHQWFGDLVTEVSGTHHWLQEGFATYYALLAERQVFGDHYYYWRLYEYAQELLQQDQANQGSALLDPKASSSTFYKRGAWALHALREQVGDEAFKTAIKSYLEQHQFRNVETKDFIRTVEKASGKDLSNFVLIWLESKTFPFDEALKSLKKSTFIQEYLMTDCEVTTSRCKDYLTSGISDEAKIKVIEQAPELVTVDAFDNSLKVRQAIAKYVVKIPLELKVKYESLLQDNSYLTIESALFNLWKNFPENQNRYLKETKGIHGFNDKNIRMLWLVLALNTPDFEPNKNQTYFEELRGYTNANYGFEIRQNAFQYLDLLQACDAVCQDNLKQATTSPIWQFSKFAKGMLEDIDKAKPVTKPRQ
ncbi:aminopeptidase [Yeosuana aromativorans]|uniref:Aminopeptidase N n=1 Tax=Yeosuana aromativorans TaxID=288019 RepID=A0A8J3BTZ1_9FLAO|nr:M1 family metallopeptidase [Yeosuana aromativorans]GGK34737.1 aminopeptidase [Yeosuana aromativorans]